MESRAAWVGIDTSSRTFAICTVDETGLCIHQAVVPSDPTAVVAYLRQTTELRAIALEACSTSLHLARVLTALGYPVSLYDPLRIHRFLTVQANKTDANDAFGLAEVARVAGGRLRTVYLRPPDLSLLRSKLMIRERVIKMRRVNEGSLINLMHSYGVRSDIKITSEASLRRAVAEMVDQASQHYDLPLADLVAPLVALSAQLRATEQMIDGELRRYARRDPTCQRLMGVPGVGVITAISFKTAIGDPSRFANASDVGAYLGLAPKVWKTGGTSRRRGISKAGNALTRRHLYIAAKAALRCRAPGRLQRWAGGIAERSGRKKALVALARKMSVIMLSLWRNESYFDPIV